MDTLTIPADDGRHFDAYLALPGHGRRAPGLVLLQYICGVNGVMRTLADGYAKLGYVVVVPDLYWRQGANIRLIEDPSRPDPVEQARALELNAGFDDAAASRDLQATLNALRGHASCDGRVGALGYCLGGRLAYLMATRTDVDCAVGYYAVNLQNYLDEASQIRSPLMLHMACEDMLVPAPVRDRVCQSLQTVPGVELLVYSKVNHAFALPGGPNHSAEAAASANAASERFLSTHLPPRPPVGA